jgi:L-iditol 2-dehydrogenase
VKAVSLKETKVVEIKEVTPPSIRDNEIKIRVKTAGICGSDIHAYNGIHPFRKPPVILGHEVAGEVVEIGAAVKRIKNGDRVTVNPQSWCGICRYCLTGDFNYCENRSAPGVGDWTGTMVEYFSAPESCVFILPETLDYEAGTLAEPLAVGVHALQKGNFRAGDRVAVLGAGPIGVLAVSAAKAAGASYVFATDVLDYALDKARECGASGTLNVKGTENWPGKALEMSGGTFDVVLIAAEAPGIINDALQLVRKGGKVVAVAMFHKEQLLDIVRIQSQEIEVIGSFTYLHEDFQTAIDLLGNGSIRVESIITHVLPYQQAQNAFEIVDQKKDCSLKVLLSY